jgi:hypothetical protein
MSGQFLFFQKLKLVDDTRHMDHSHPLVRDFFRRKISKSKITNESITLVI